MKRLPFLAGSVALLAAAGARDWDRVVGAAKNEGAVTMYANAGNDKELRAAADAFHARYGITVTLAYGSGPLNLQKILAEVQTGHVQCDVVYAGFSDIDILDKQGHLLPLDVPNAAGILTPFKVLDVATPLFVNLYGILVNTKALGRTPVPASWKALLDPAFANQLVMPDPRIDGGGFSRFQATYDKLGPGYERALAAQHPAINSAGSGIAAEESVARGDYAVLVGGRPRAIAAYPQVPLRWISPAEGAVPVPIGMSLIKAAQHPNAARLWANHLLEPAVQSSLSENVLPVVRNTRLINPVFRQKITFLEIFSPHQDRTNYYAYAKQLYGTQ